MDFLVIVYTVSVTLIQCSAFGRMSSEFFLMLNGRQKEAE